MYLNYLCFLVIQSQNKFLGIGRIGGDGESLLQNILHLILLQLRSPLFHFFLEFLQSQTFGFVRGHDAVGGVDEDFFGTFLLRRDLDFGLLGSR